MYSNGCDRYLVFKIGAQREKPIDAIYDDPVYIFGHRCRLPNFDEADADVWDTWKSQNSRCDVGAT